MPNLAAPIVIIGAGGSGTSLLNEMLGAHPRVEMKGEMNFLAADAWKAFCGADANTTFRDLERHFRADPGLETRITNAQDQFRDFLALLEREEMARRGAVLRAAIGDWFALQDSDAAAWGFKEIFNANTDWSPYDHIFPQAVWVHIVRHPLDRLHAAARLSNTPLSREMIAETLETWLRILRLSEQRAATGRYHEVRYEDLLTAPEQTLTPILEGINLDWSGDCAWPLTRQWGERSPRAPLPTVMPALIDGTPGLREAMHRHHYDPEGPSLDIDLPQPPPPHLEEIAPGRWKLASPIFREEGRCWQFDLGATALGDRLAPLADSVGKWRQSPLRLYENETPLGPAHALHFRIRATGGGLYSHWEQRLLFATSDNSNPNTNGRTYSFDLGAA